jgi:kynurenine 3-monooxygenase
MSQVPSRFTVVGAGLGGALMAIYLGREGHEVHVYEQRPDPRLADRQEGRSINLAISTRGLDALGRVGLAGAVLDMAVPMRGRMVHLPTGRCAFQPYGTEDDQAINSVSRAGLNMLLLDAAEQLTNVRLSFSQRLSGIDLETGMLNLQEEHSGKTREVAGGVIVGADGAFSVVRRQMQRLDHFNYQQSYLEHGYKELVIPPAGDAGFRMERNALHIWPRGGYMMIALPNRDGSFTCTLFWPFAGPNSFASLETEADVRRFFSEHFPDAVPHMPDLVSQYFDNPASSLVTIHCGPWYSGDRAVLLGDACHAVVPFYGQGANAAFADCPILSDALKQHAPSWQLAFAEYYEHRKLHTDALAELALDNFVEMRDRVGSEQFRFKKKAEKLLHVLFPRWFTPLYSMVTFSLMPYADAVRQAKRQEVMVRRLLGFLLLLLLIGAVWLWS